MALETVVYINDLNADNPVASDKFALGAAHIRAVKTALLNTFPNIDGAVTATDTELNLLDGITASAAELNIMDGATITVTELNYADGLTSAFQTQIATKADELTTQEKTSDFTAAAGYRYIVNIPSGGPGEQGFTVPASGSVGQRFIAHNLDLTNSIYVQPSGKLNGSTGASGIAAGGTGEFSWVDSTTGWAFFQA